jgi:hypothetical protein
MPRGQTNVSATNPDRPPCATALKYDGCTPVADRIRERIIKTGDRFHANDNQPGYVREIIQRVRPHLAEREDA